jgi:hypothetical protein
MGVAYINSCVHVYKRGFYVNPPCIRTGLHHPHTHYLDLPKMLGNYIISLYRRLLFQCLWFRTGLILQPCSYTCVVLRTLSSQDSKSFVFLEPSNWPGCMGKQHESLHVPLRKNTSGVCVRCLSACMGACMRMLD